MLQNYLACGGNTSESLDFFALNAYEWCGSSSYPISGYSMLQQNATGYDIPIFFSETGCNTAPPRTFEDQAAILGSQMENTWSGAIVYEWVEETNNYGLITYGASTVTASVTSWPTSGTPMPISPDYQNLKSQWATLTPSGVALSAYSASASSLTAPVCPSSTSGGWLINGNPPLPTVGESLNRATGASATPTGTATGSSASATATKKGDASGGKEMAGMSIGLAGVMLGFIVWL